jgi:hypothetical protein
MGGKIYWGDAEIDTGDYEDLYDKVRLCIRMRNDAGKKRMIPEITTIYMIK